MVAATAVTGDNAVTKKDSKSIVTLGCVVAMLEHSAILLKLTQNKGQSNPEAKRLEIVARELLAAINQHGLKVLNQKIQRNQSVSVLDFAAGQLEALSFQQSENSLERQTAEAAVSGLAYWARAIEAGII